jgi:hypothetical protein
MASWDAHVGTTANRCTLATKLMCASQEVFPCLLRIAYPGKACNNHGEGDSGPLGARDRYSTGAGYILTASCGRLCLKVWLAGSELS